MSMILRFNLQFKSILFGLVILGLCSGAGTLMAQQPIEVQSDTETGYAEFIAVKNTFFDEQTASNRDAYNEVSGRWALSVLDAQLQYLNQIEADLYTQLAVTDMVPEKWLDTERQALQSIRSDVESIGTYGRIAELMITDTAEIWADARMKIQQMRAWIAYDPYAVALIRARVIHDGISQAQTEVVTQATNSGRTVDWTAWQQVFDTYTEKLIFLEKSLTENRGEFGTTGYSSMDENDQAWVEDMTFLKTMPVELRTLATLQESSIQQFLTVFSSLITSP